MSAAEPNPSVDRSGIVTFAGLVFVLAGIFNAIVGLVGILNPDYFTDNTLFASIQAWGWAILLLGLLQLGTGVGILARRLGGMLLGILLAMTGMVLHVAFVAAFPIWSVSVMALQLILIFVLTVHAHEFE